MLPATTYLLGKDGGVVYRAVSDAAATHAIVLIRFGRSLVVRLRTGRVWHQVLACRWVHAQSPLTPSHFVVVDDVHTERVETDLVNRRMCSPVWSQRALVIIFVTFTNSSKN